MSWDDTKCPCGGQKLPQTLICEPCLAVANSIQLRTFLDLQEQVEWRRWAAIKLLAAARSRTAIRPRSAATLP